MSDIEIWKDAVGFEGKYQISNFGNVRSLDYDFEAFNGVKVCKFHHKGKPMKTQVSACGYKVVSLGKKKNMQVHILVAKAFIENPNNKPCVNHIDGNKLNAHVDNLEWVTYGENNLHALRNGLRPSGERYPYSKLTDEIVRKIRTEYKPHTKGVGCKSIAKKYGIHHSIAQKIINGTSWRYLV